MRPMQISTIRQAPRLNVSFLKKYRRSSCRMEATGLSHDAALAFSGADPYKTFSLQVPFAGVRSSVYGLASRLMAVLLDLHVLERVQ